MMRAIGLGVGLFGLWLALSGYFKPFLLSLGVLSCIATVLIAQRMRLLDRETVPLELPLTLLLYWAWLGREVMKSSIAVSRVILARKMPIAQQLIRVPTTQHTEMGHTIFANSITLTPGTVTVETTDDSYIIHALTDAACDMDGFASMDARAAKVGGA